jgi:hypothetical protein
MMKLSHVGWDELPAVYQSLLRVKRKGKERWAPAFVLERVREGLAGLFRFEEEGKHYGYMVVERIDQGDGVWMNVWALEGKGLDRFGDCLPLVDNLAASIGATSWRCAGRKGWGAMGLKPIATVFEREIT